MVGKGSACFLGSRRGPVGTASGEFQDRFEEGGAAVSSVAKTNSYRVPSYKPVSQSPNGCCER